MNKLIDASLEDKISNDLCKKFNKIVNPVELEKKLYKNGIEETLGCYFFKEDLDDSIKKIKNQLSIDPSSFIKNAFGLKEEHVEVKYTISGENYDKFTLSGTCSDEANIYGYSQILSAKKTNWISSFHSEDKENDLSNEAQIELRVHTIAPFEKKVYYSCKYNCFTISDMVLFDEMEHYMTLEVVGIRENENVPACLLDLIDSSSNVKVNNVKMAFLNVFTALDYYIEALYTILFEHYIEKYNFYCKKSPKDADNLKERIRRYSNVGRSLLNEKLKDIWKESGRSNIYFSILKGELNLLVDKRNKLAHGENVEIEKDDYGKLLYYFFDLVFLINENKSLKDIFESYLQVSQ